MDLARKAYALPPLIDLCRAQTVAGSPTVPPTPQTAASAGNLPLLLALVPICRVGQIYFLDGSP
jgi:hypothetical protein